jgi:hypothetical protein
MGADILPKRKLTQKGGDGRYDFQIITFQDLKNAAVIAEIITIGSAFLIRPRCPSYTERDLTR